jgi:hypothetical protein
LEGRGDFIAVAEGKVTRFQAAHVSPREIREVVAKMSRGTRKVLSARVRAVGSGSERGVGR